MRQTLNAAVLGSLVALGGCNERSQRDIDITILQNQQEVINKLKNEIRNKTGDVMPDEVINSEIRRAECIDATVGNPFDKGFMGQCGGKETLDSVCFAYKAKSADLKGMRRCNDLWTRNLGEIKTNLSSKITPEPKASGNYTPDKPEGR